MRVLKFGGSSVANSQNLERVLSVVTKSVSSNDKTCIVLSALGGVTDQLLKAGRLAMQQDESYIDILQTITDRHIAIVREMIPVQSQSPLLTKVKSFCNEIEDICKGVYLVRELTSHTSDSICSYGEILSTTIFSEVLSFNGISNLWCDSRKYIKTNNGFGNAAVDLPRSSSLLKDLVRANDTKCFVFPGFIGSNAEGKVTTLGRGGSDYTAAIIAEAVQADEVEIWTDVSGMMTADPGLVKNARIIHHISYEEALELSHFGAKVIYPKTIAPAMRSGIPIAVKNSFAPEDPGTRIFSESVNGNPIKGISSRKQLAILTLEGSGMIGIPGFSKRLFEALATEMINVILITQSSSEYSICVVVDEPVSARAKVVLDSVFSMEIEMGKVKPVMVETGMAIVALVGDSMKRRTGMSGKMFSALGRNNINVRAIAQGSSERNISAVIVEQDVKKALNVLHEEFFENTYKQINLFICGTGNVGKRLIAQLNRQHDFLKQKMRLHVRIMGLANSRKMAFSEEGIPGADWQSVLDDGSLMDLASFANTAVAENRRNSIFVDVTANEAVARCYPQMLEKNISVVACNKIACSSPYDYYSELKETAARHNASFLFETNVGAGLPIIGTLNDLLRSGDEIIKIEAVLSGTLNYVFNNYDGTLPFADIVRQAAQEGYTEPDPRLDLSGVDVMRKILILARESGNKIELSDVANQSFMPEACMTGSIEHFYEEMEKHEDHFRQLLQSAREKNCKLKYVARFENGRASTGLDEVEPGSDFYHLYGKDNVVLFYTQRYPEQPLVIKGAGAGAEVTASGVFADILRSAASF